MEPSDVAACKADMADAAKAAAEILHALDAVPPMFGDRTWRGPAADRWAAGWNARKSRLAALLRAVLAEQPHLIARVEEAERRRAVS